MGAMADQIPFALATALNKSADAAREELPQIWAEHIKVRNPNFLKAALTTRGARATKRSLRVTLYDQYGRGNLKLHDVGGTARAKSGAMAVPTSTISAKRGSKGIPKGMQPRNLANSFMVTGKSGDKLIFQRPGKSKRKAKTTKASGALKLAYVIKSTNPVHADVPLTSEFQRIVQREMPKQFKAAIVRAMSTARKTR